MRIGTSHTYRLSLSLSLSLYICINIYMYTCICIYEYQLLMASQIGSLRLSNITVSVQVNGVIFMFLCGLDVELIAIGRLVVERVID